MATQQRLDEVFDTAKPTVELFTDGGCEPNPGEGGWGFVLIYGEHVKEGSGYESEATNNTMEIRAVIEGLRALKKPCNVTITSDSQYVIKCASGEWKRKTNHDLWRELDTVMDQHTVKWQWVRGHTGDKYNERCHELAQTAIRTKGRK